MKILQFFFCLLFTFQCCKYMPTYQTEDVEICPEIIKLIKLDWKQYRKPNGNIFNLILNKKMNYYCKGDFIQDLEYLIKLNKNCSEKITPSKIICLLGNADFIDYSFYENNPIYKNVLKANSNVFSLEYCCNLENKLKNNWKTGIHGNTELNQDCFKFIFLKKTDKFVTLIN